MKKLKFLMLTCILVLSLILCQQIVSAKVIKDTPDDWQLVAYDGFDNLTQESISFSDYTGGEGFTTGWKSNVELTEELPFEGTPRYYIDENGHLKAYGKSKYLYRGLTNPIDFDGDCEYFLSFTFVSRGDSSCIQSIYLITNGLPDLLNFGEVKSNNNPNGPYSQPCVAWQKTSKPGWMRTPTDGATMITVVMQISARSDNYDIYKVRAFPHVEGAETPSFTPSYWDTEARFMNNENERFADILCIRLYTNAGSNYLSTVDELAIYKSSAVEVTKTNANPERDSNAYAFSTVGDILTIGEIPETNIHGNPQSLVSIGWYDYTDMENPVLLSEDASYTIPAEMKGRLLKAKVVIKDEVTQKETTYFPYARYIDDIYNVTRAFFTTGKSSVKKTDSISAGEDKNIGFFADIYRTNNVLADRIDDSAKVIIAQYDSSGILKKTVIANGGLKINPEGYTRPHAILQGITIEPGDIFKGYVWYNFDSIKPIPLNPNVLDDYYLDFEMITE